MLVIYLKYFHSFFLQYIHYLISEKYRLSKSVDFKFYQENIFLNIEKKGKE